MAGSVGVKVTCLVVMCMLVASPMAVEGLSCDQVATYLVPCIFYLIGVAGPVPSECCNSVRTLKTSAETPDDSRTACRCLINAFVSIPGVNLDIAVELPGQCGVTMPYKISPSTSCSNVN